MHARSRARPGCHSEPEGLPPKGAGSAVSGRWSPEERRSVRRLSEGGPRLSRGASLPPTDRDGMFPNGKGNSDGGWMRLPPEQRCQYFKAKPLRKQLRGTQPRAKPRGGRSLSSLQTPRCPAGTEDADARTARKDRRLHPRGPRAGVRRVPYVVPHVVGRSEAARPAHRACPRLSAADLRAPQAHPSSQRHRSAAPGRGV